MGDDRVGDPLKLLLEESLMQPRNEMMNNFPQILQWMLTSMGAPLMSSHLRGASPFKV